MSLLVCLAILVAFQDEEASGPAVPLVGRPDDFSGASGRFDIEMDVEPDRLAVDEPCVLRVIIRAIGPVLAPPERLPLSEALQADFHIEELGLFPTLDETVRAATLFGLGAGSSFPIETLAGAMPTRGWEFRYRLRPRRKDVDEVPGLALCFHDPILQTASRPFMTVYADPYPITVTPPTGARVPLSGPESLFVPVSGDLLSAWSLPRLPSLPVLLVLLALPVVGCAIWYRVWMRLYPDAARQASLRRSRAARRALADLDRLPRRSDRITSGQVAEVLARYLRERLDLRQTEPTPTETAEHLRRQELGSLAEPARMLLERLDALRFGASDATHELVRGEVRDFILALEEATCPPSA